MASALSAPPTCLSRSARGGFSCAPTDSIICTCAGHVLNRLRRHRPCRMCARLRKHVVRACFDLCRPYREVVMCFSDDHVNFGVAPPARAAELCMHCGQMFRGGRRAVTPCRPMAILGWRRPSPDASMPLCAPRRSGNVFAPPPPAGMLLRQARDLVRAMGWCPIPCAGHGAECSSSRVRPMATGCRRLRKRRAWWHA